MAAAPAGTCSRASPSREEMQRARLARALARHARPAWRTSSCRQRGIRARHDRLLRHARQGPVGNAAGGRCACSRAFWQACGVMRRAQPDAVLGMGGYVCFPGGLMAWLRGKPLVLVNADAIAGC